MWSTAWCSETVWRCFTEVQRWVVNVLSLYYVLQNTSTYKVVIFSHSDLKLQLQNTGEESALKESSMRESITSLTKEKDKLLHISVERGKIIQVTEEFFGFNQSLHVFTKWSNNYRRNKRNCCSWRKNIKKRKKLGPKQRTGKNPQCFQCTAAWRASGVQLVTSLFVTHIRFEQEVEAVNADVKVKSLQCALDESNIKHEKLNKVSWHLRFLKVMLSVAHAEMRTCFISHILQDFEAFREHSNNLLIHERELNKKLRHMIS